MKVFKIEIMVIDFDQCGGEEIKDILESARYPNDAISPYVMDIKSVDIGKWHDDNPLNNLKTQASEFKRLFPDKVTPI